jgi:hypothetical protein
MLGELQPRVAARTKSQAIVLDPWPHPGRALRDLSRQRSASGTAGGACDVECGEHGERPISAAEIDPF